MRLLGDLCVSRGDLTSVAFPTARCAAVLAYLAFHEGRAVYREEVAAAVWPGRDLDSARHSLRQTLVHIRRAIGKSETGFLLETGRAHLRLIPDAVTGDLFAFRKAISISPLRAKERVQGLRAAVAVYGGPFLPGVEEEWALAARTSLSAAYVRAAMELAERILPTNPREALDLADRVVEEEPLLDGARALKIRALRAMGEDTAARREYQSFEELVLREVGVGPSKVVRSALLADAALGLPPSPDGGESVPSGIDDALGTLAGRPGAESLRLALALVPYWICQGSPSKGIDWIHRLRGRGTLDLSDRERIEAEVALAELEHEKGNPRAAIEHVDPVLQVLRAQPASELLVRALSVCCYALLRVHNAWGAESAALEAIAACRLLGLRRAEFSALTGLRIARNELGDLGAARETAEREAQLAEELGDKVGLLTAWVASAFLRFHEGFPAESQVLANRVRTQLDRLGPSREMATMYVRLARLLDELGNFEAAVEGYQRVASYSRDTGDSWLLCQALTCLGDLETDMGLPEQAIPRHQECISLRREAQEWLGVATSLRGLGVALQALGRNEGAQAALTESMGLYQAEGHRPGVASVLMTLSKTEWAVGNRATAHSLILRAIETLRALTPLDRVMIAPRGRYLLEVAESQLADMRLER
jgi:DNA-binding SARP family transcriptional activator